ncbi:MAG: hypothetical protein KGD64_10665, partial [Candidatus Heimdallarchaeota archaeon]|nr:hypothetical protein [Candidatus Heimdallarchaeota archaeon]
AELLDIGSFQHLPYGTRQYFSQNRWGLTGESAAFTDPFYSPGSDFIASIIDGRLFPQLMKMIDTYPNTILILESLDQLVFETTSMNLSSIYGALSYVAYKMGVAVIPTRDLEDTIIVLERIAYREQIEDIKPVMSRRAPKGMTIDDRRAFAIEGLIDTGPKKAQALIEKFGTPLNVFEGIKNTKITYTKTGSPSGIEGPLQDLPGFGWKYVQKNKELLIGFERE